VIEDRGGPVLFDMAGLALVSEPALVSLPVVVLLVACRTGRPEFCAVEVAGVASRALGEPVFSPQRVFGVAVMVEADGFPAAIDMAGLALLAEATLVAALVVVLAMTSDASGRFALEFWILVAIATSDFPVLAGKREARFAMVKNRILPARVPVAVGAAVPELALMGIVLAMAGDTIRRRVAVLFTRLMTVPTADL